MPYGVISLMLFALMLSAPANAQLFTPDACPSGFRWGWDLHCHPAAYRPHYGLIVPRRLGESRVSRQR